MRWTITTNGCTMTRYVAFLRGVNVGGHTMVKTSDICQGLSARGFAHVKGYKQSGNIRCSMPGTPTPTELPVRSGK